MQEWSPIGAISVPGGSYFFTVNLAERRPGFLTENIGLLRIAFRHVRAHHPFTIEAAVILPDHLHAIWTLPEHDADLALRWRLIKAAFSLGPPRGEAPQPKHQRRTRDLAAAVLEAYAA
jgi:putative transposase